MVVAFSAFFYRTEVLLEISKVVSANGVKVVWYSSDPDITNFLLENNVENIDILKLHQWKGYGEKDSNCLKEIDNINGYELNTMISNDRLLSRYSADFIDSYINKTSMMIEEFIEDRSVKIVIGEPTPVVEQVVAAICKNKNIKYVVPTPTRIPNKRFFFFEFKDYYNPVVNSVSSEENTIEVEKPDYWVMNKNKKNKIISVAKVFRILHKELSLRDIDPTRPRLDYNLSAKIRSVFNKLLFKFRSIKKLCEIDINEKYVLYTMHRQPEASVDVLSPLMNNQAYIINTISKLIPYGYKLIVKPNQNGLGEFGSSFYNQIDAHNVIVVDPRVDSKDLIKISDITFSITGTSALEAGMFGKKAITFNKLFFSRLKGVCYCGDINNLKSLITRQLSNEYSDGMTLEEYSTFVYSSSFEGEYHDSNFNPDSLRQDNINKLSRAFMRLFLSVS